LDTRNLDLVELPELDNDREFLLDLGFPALVLLGTKPREFGDFELLDLKLLLVLLELSSDDPLSP
jgi:hypothetical protein